MQRQQVFSSHQIMVVFLVCTTVMLLMYWQLFQQETGTAVFWYLLVVTAMLPVMFGWAIGLIPQICRETSAHPTRLWRGLLVVSGLVAIAWLWPAWQHWQHLQRYYTGLGMEDWEHTQATMAYMGVTIWLTGMATFGVFRAVMAARCLCHVAWQTRHGR